MSESDFLSDDEAILAEFIDESESSLAAMDTLFVDLEKAPANTEIVDAIFRPIHSLKANSAFLGLLRLKELAQNMETLLDAVRQKKKTVTREIIDLLLAGVDELRAIVGRIKAKAPEVENGESFRALVDRLAAFIDTGHKSSPPLGQEGRGKTPDGVTVAPSVDTTAGVPVRVQSSLLDALVSRTDRIGGIVDSLEQSVNRSNVLPPNDKQTDVTVVVGQLVVAMADVKDAVGKIHKVPLSDLFQKIPRIVRSLCVECRKEVTVTLRGGGILVTRQILQGLDAPLTHMVRNAVDHGAESPDERRRMGKPRECRLVIQAHELQGELILKVSDDGAGIDGRALLAKALREGVISPNQKVTPQDVANLIFLPGVSLAKKITDTSGRGVGMDVVKSNMKQLGGTVEVQCAEGKGTDFIIRIPNP